MTEDELTQLSSRLGPLDQALDHQPGLRHAAVLAILYESAGRTVIPLIERPHGQGVHSGQLALPGGALDSGDESLMHTALREAREEIGVDPGELRILGRLPEVMVRVSGFVVAPFVAWSATEPQLFPNDEE